MAREIHEREDLLRDARALVPRIKLRVTIGGREQEVFAGFRGEALSLYFGDDPVYHFNSRGELRRAFVDDRLVKAERGRLVVLERRQSSTESLLQRQLYNTVAEAKLLSQMNTALAELGRSISDGHVQTVGQAPPDGDAVERLAAWLAGHPTPAIAASPRVG
ncbi:MAG TPA: hypothetical protein VF175_09685 [Lacipirellula sp.]